MSNQSPYTADEITAMAKEQEVGAIVIAPVATRSGRPMLLVCQKGHKTVIGITLTQDLAQKASIAIALFLEQCGTAKNN